MTNECGHTVMGQVDSTSQAIRCLASLNFALFGNMQRVQGTRNKTNRYSPRETSILSDVGNYPTSPFIFKGHCRHQIALKQLQNWYCWSVISQKRYLYHQPKITWIQQKQATFWLIALPSGSQEHWGCFWWTISFPFSFRTPLCSSAKAETALPR